MRRKPVLLLSAVVVVVLVAVAVFTHTAQAAQDPEFVSLYFCNCSTYSDLSSGTRSYVEDASQVSPRLHEFSRKGYRVVDAVSFSGNPEAKSDLGRVNYMIIIMRRS